MAIVQEAFDIPSSIMTKILTGEYVRMGGIVRHAGGVKKGQIVKHLKPIDLKAAEQVQGLSYKAIKFAKNNKESLIIGGIIAAVGGGTITYHKLKNREPKLISEFRATLKVYIDAVRKGTLNIEIISNLIENLAEIKEHINYEKINVQLSTEEIGVLINHIHDYTEKLVSDNAIELTEQEKRVTSTKNKNIIDLQDYLKLQKRIFEVA